MNMEQERQQAKMLGIKRAWDGMTDQEQKIAMAFYVTYAKENFQFEGGDVLAAWRATGSKIALKNWRNRWGAVSRMAASQKFQIIKKIGEVTPKNKQSHGDRANLWESQIYEGHK